MTESMIVEAVRGVSAATAQQQTAAAQPVADPDAVSKFQAAMGATGVQDADPIPFASQVAASWRSAQANNQGILHRIRSLCALERPGNVAAPELVELQYEVMNLAFQQEVVTRVADKSSTAIQTLVKNQ